MRHAVPRVVTDYAPGPQEICPGVWSLERRLRHFGLALLPSRSSILRLADAELAVISPPPLVDAGTIAALDRLGTVTTVVVPNTFHYLYAAEFMQCYPEARLLGAPGLRARAPELRLDAELTPDAPHAWHGVLDYLVLGPHRGVSELLLFHRPSKTLLLTDLAFNMRQYPRRLDRIVWRLSGVPRAFGPGRTSRSLLMRDRRAVSQTLEAALRWPFERIVVAHGDLVSQSARSELARAFSQYL